MPVSEEDKERYRLEEVREQEKLDSIKAVNHINDSINSIKKEREDLLSLRKTLDNEIKSIDKGIDFSKYRGSGDKLKYELLLFKIWSSFIEDGLNSEDDTTKTLANKLKGKVVKLQVKQLPIMRKEFVRITKKVLWEHDIDVYSKGSNRYIYLVNRAFASNGNIKEFQESLDVNLNDFRFTQAHYLWYKGDDEHQYYTMKPKKDSELY